MCLPGIFAYRGHFFCLVNLISDKKELIVISDNASKQKVFDNIDLSLKGTANTCIYIDQIVFKGNHKCGLHLNNKLKRHNFLIKHSAYQISDLGRRSNKTQGQS